MAAQPASNSDHGTAAQLADESGRHTRRCAQRYAPCRHHLIVRRRPFSAARTGQRTTITATVRRSLAAVHPFGMHDASGHRADGCDCQSAPVRWHTPVTPAHTACAGSAGCQRLYCDCAGGHGRCFAGTPCCQPWQTECAVLIAATSASPFRPLTGTCFIAGCTVCIAAGRHRLSQTRGLTPPAARRFAAPYQCGFAAGNRSVIRRTASAAGLACGSGTLRIHTGIARPYGTQRSVTAVSATLTDPFMQLAATPPACHQHTDHSFAV